ncbi:putative LLM family oxidoreductase [Sphingobacterium allocomposti]|uniref:Putative LLM family oxidoreductase n=1 Tax=Sphingobacterium allocomposti TaxID=415956 RepID=A0A5S5D8K8_9SPHI|nr:LLM class flavin-dependent oxidoreductase [Sphingobacterium composti Yoo et al. 2007 non Ten et al. 2007]TYP91804.1 putative LLM family oxidoreductase [Sphingobacterium composti Yoo et al. 2007 non Ten et al. 2007]
MIELGIGMFGDVQIDPVTGKVQPAAERMQQIVEEIKLMDEVGVDFFGMGEHHREDYAVASPEIILAAAATVTKNIKLGSAVSVLSSADPVKLFQDFSTVDILSNGRAEIMAGRGSFIESFPLFGYDLKDYAALFEEKLDLLLRLNKQDTVTWSGKFRKPLVNQQIFPRPVHGSLPIWVAVGGTTSSVIRAGKLGLPVMFAIIGGAPENFKPLFEVYQQAWVDNGHDMKDFQVGVHMHSFFGEDSRSVADKYYPIYAAQMNRIGASRGWPPYQRQQYDFGRSIHGHLVVGDVNQSVEKILHIIELFGLTRFSAHMDVGSPDHTDMMKAIELYGTKIVPKVKEALRK